jgi:hypothetical protein
MSANDADTVATHQFRSEAPKEPEGCEWSLVACMTGRSPASHLLWTDRRGAQT